MHFQYLNHQECFHPYTHSGITKSLSTRVNGATFFSLTPDTSRTASWSEEYIAVFPTFQFVLILIFLHASALQSSHTEMRLTLLSHILC